MRQFVAEQFLPAADADAAARRAAAADAAAGELSRAGTRVQLVRAIFIPEDETCIDLYWADSIAAVKAAAERASLRLERISEAVSWGPAEKSP